MRISDWSSDVCSSDLSTTARPIIEQISLMRSRNGRYADLLIADANSYQPISASFVAHQRIVSERLGRLGFSGLSYITPAGPVDIVAAGGIELGRASCRERVGTHV